MRSLLALLTPAERFRCLALLTGATGIAAELAAQLSPDWRLAGLAATAAFGTVTTGHGLVAFRSQTAMLDQLKGELEESQLQTASALADRRMRPDHRLGESRLELLAALRRQPIMPPALRRLIDDYAWLLQANEPPQHPPAPFDLGNCLDAALVSARSLTASGPHLHVSISLAPGLPQRWLGHGQLVECLCRHLLLIGMNQNDTGLVRLRLESDQPVSQTNRLQFTLSSNHARPDASWMHRDLSLQLIETMLDGLGGSFRQVDSPDSMILTGWLPCQPIQAERTIDRPTNDQLFKQQPLVLTIADPARGAILTQLLHSAGCQVVMFSTQADALVWAPLLPCAALLIDLPLAEAQQQFVRQLRRAVDSERPSACPLWLTMASLDRELQRRWLDAGIDCLLQLPVEQAGLAALCRDLSPPSRLFYRQQDEQLRAELPVKASQRLPELNEILSCRLIELQELLTSLAAGHSNDQAATVFHEVKSIALSLGYFRLAALMGACEATTQCPQSAFAAANWLTLGYYLCPGDCSFPLTSLPVLTDESMPSTPGYRL